jgi:hypothetical protein
MGIFSFKNHAFFLLSSIHLMFRYFWTRRGESKGFYKGGSNVNFRFLRGGVCYEFRSSKEGPTLKMRHFYLISTELSRGKGEGSDPPYSITPLWIRRWPVPTHRAWRKNTDSFTQKAYFHRQNADVCKNHKFFILLHNLYQKNLSFFFNLLSLHLFTFVN